MILKRALVPFAVLSVALLALLAPATSRASAGSINVFLGQKFLDEDDWEPIEDQTELGIDAAFGGSDWPVWINVGLFGSNDEDDLSVDEEIEGSTTEFCVGINKTWTGRQFHPYIAGGIAFVSTEVELRDDAGSVQDDDAAIGLYLGGGGYWRLGSSFNLGGMLRFTMADVDVFGEEFSGGGAHLGLTLGWGWPKRGR